MLLNFLIVTAKVSTKKCQIFIVTATIYRSFTIPCQIRRQYTCMIRKRKIIRDFVTRRKRVTVVVVNQLAELSPIDVIVAFENNKAIIFIYRSLNYCTQSPRATVLLPYTHSQVFFFVFHSHYKTIIPFEFAMFTRHPFLSHPIQSWQTPTTT